LQDEVQHFLVSLVFGIIGLLLFRAFSGLSQKRPLGGVKLGKTASSEDDDLREADEDDEQGVDDASRTKCVLHHNLSSQVVSFLEPRSVSVLGTSSSALNRQFWQSPEVWRQLAIDRGLHLHLPSGASFTDLGAVVREAFRRGAFGIEEGIHLGLLAAKSERADHADVLQAATRMLSGLMLRDGSAAIEGLCAAVVKILQKHHSGLSSAVVVQESCTFQCPDSGAVELFLQTARRRLDLLTSEQLDRLEVAACDSAARLDMLMEIAMRSFYAGLPNVRAELQETDTYVGALEGTPSLPEQDVAFWEGLQDAMQENDAMHERELEVHRHEAVARMLEVEYDLMHEAEHDRN
jgi:hypothetical protein